MRLSQEWNDRFGYMMLQMSAQKKELIEYPIDLYITIVVHPRTDSDAIIKGLFDSMEESGLIKNDNLIRDFLIIRGEYSGEEMAVVKSPKPVTLLWISYTMRSRKQGVWMKIRKSISIENEAAERFERYAEANNRTLSELMVEATEQMIRRYSKSKTKEIRRDLSEIIEKATELYNYVPESDSLEDPDT